MVLHEMLSYETLRLVWWLLLGVLLAVAWPLLRLLWRGR